MIKAFEKLDELTSGSLSRAESDPSQYARRVKQYNVLLKEILDTRINIDDKKEEILGKIEDTIAEFKLKHSLPGNADILKTLNNLVRFKKGLYVSANQKAYMKSAIFDSGTPYDSSKNGFMTAMLDHMKASDIGIIYEQFRFGEGMRNWGYVFYFLDEIGVRKAVKSTHYFKQVKTDRMAGFSKERYNFTRARKNEMLAGLNEPDEKLLDKEEIIFERQE